MELSKEYRGGLEREMVRLEREWKRMEKEGEMVEDGPCLFAAVRRTLPRSSPAPPEERDLSFPFPLSLSFYPSHSPLSLSPHPRLKLPPPNLNGRMAEMGV